MVLSRFLAGIRRGGTSHLERELESLRADLGRLRGKVERIEELDERLTQLEQRATNGPAPVLSADPAGALQELRDEIDECRRDNLRIAELYDLTLDRLGEPIR
jgi:hypothetical protein